MSISSEELRQARFYLDSEPEVIFRGYTEGDTWNGFACPYLEFSVAQEVARLYEETHGGNWKAKYISEEDTFRFHDPAYEEPEEFAPVKLSGDERLYAIGAYSWAWHEVDAEG